MSRITGFRNLGRLCLGTAMLSLCVLVSPASASDRVPPSASDMDSIEVYSDAVRVDGAMQPAVDRLVASQFISRLEAEGSVTSDEQPSPVAQIAEPGTLGLMALAGLMGGAIAMRRRLG